MVKLIFISFILFSALRSGAQNFDSLKSTLNQMYVYSLKQRQQMGTIVSKYGVKSLKFDSLNKAIRKYDSISLAVVKEIVEKHGWLQKKQVGVSASKSLFLIIQHSNLDDMEKFFPLLKATADIGQADLSDVALMEDRILIEKGMPQRYGTQYRWNEEKKRYILLPVKDLKNINNLRKKMRLQPLKNFLKENQIFIE